MIKHKFYLIISFSLLFQTIITSQNSWQLIGLKKLRIEYVYAKGDTIWTTTEDSLYNHETYYSYNGGEAWSKFELNNSEFGGGYTLKTIDPRNTQKMYITDWYGRPWKTKDAGSSWEYLIPEAEPWPVDAWRPRVKDIYISPHNEDVLFCIITENGQVDNLYRTSNGGKNWVNVSSFAASSHGVELSFAFDLLDTTKIFVSADNNIGYQAFYTSYNLGNSWDLLTELQTFANKIIVNHIDNNIIYRFLKPYRSLDGGFTWKRIMEDLIKEDVPYQPSITSVIINQSEPKILYASLAKIDILNNVLIPMGVYKTQDGGDNWGLMKGSDNIDLITNEFLPILFFDSIQQNLFIGTQHGLFKFNAIVSIKNCKAIPTKLKLNQNYPNPFNPNTIISYQLPVGGFVELKIYDQLGREIKTLVKEEQNSGFYKFNFEVKELSSGVYFYRLNVSESNRNSSFVETRKMLILK
ncbi:hypothetical protein MNBD_IGNAVI01-37 [hydrothermal vent metagenome]|uniref:Secretion system C-terminal sorting domain-containing protein n=1 Tax=hydrothermal vent metagenome TaxID=652676 RepID=A0A3B1CI72_9ZZZZ